MITLLRDVKVKREVGEIWHFIQKWEESAGEPYSIIWLFFSKIHPVGYCVYYT